MQYLARHLKWPALGIGSVVVIGLAIANIGATQPLNLQSVTARTLGASGWQLTQPGPLERPTIQADAARRVVLSQFPGAQVRETVLAHVYNNHVVPNLDRMVWVVSIVPAGGIHGNPPPGGAPIQGSYFLVFVDASTGQLLMATSGGEVSS